MKAVLCRVFQDVMKAFSDVPCGFEEGVLRVSSRAL